MGLRMNNFEINVGSLKIPIYREVNEKTNLQGGIA